MYNDGFSEFEIKESSIKVGDDEAFEKIGCVGTAEETLNIRFVTKTLYFIRLTAYLLTGNKQTPIIIHTMLVIIS